MLNKGKEHKLQKQVIKKEKETLIFQIKLSFVVRKLLKVILKNLFGKLSVNCQLKSRTLKIDSIFPVIDLLEN